eukprot:TRINITY_DN7519_c0_g1_i1.p1 TRINITY_DN7519_c0_g1~~TRINITY_DN7519_c0_g1_i1.p1  ORF type:complete len:619 (+),score=160.23 TRINITY_DN7519_c0_g1_i1:66-1922(+)
MSVAESRVRFLENRVHELEAERDALRFQMREISNDHIAEKKALQVTIDDLSKRRDAMKEKLDRIERIEQFVINLFIEMKDRSADADTPDFEAEREELSKLNIMVVLDKLRASLRHLQTFKEDYENELRGLLGRRKAEAELKVAELQKTVSDLVDAKGRAETVAEQAAQKMQRVESQHRGLVDESQSLMTQLTADNERLAKLVKNNQDELSKMRDELDQREQQLRHKDIRLMRIAQLETAIQSNKIQHQFDLQKLQARHVKTLKEFEKEIGRFSKTEAENQAFRQMLGTAEKKMMSYSKHIKKISLDDLNKKIEHLENIVTHKNDEIASMTRELRHAQFMAETSVKKNETLKKEYDKVFTAVHQSRDQDRLRDERAQKAINVHEAVDEIPAHVDVYKAKLREREREVKELSERVKRLLATEHRHIIAEKTAEAERARHESEIASLRMQLAKASGGSTTSLSYAPPQSTIKRPMTSSGRAASPSRMSATPVRASTPASATAGRTMTHLTTLSIDAADDEVEYLRSLEDRNAELEERLKEYSNIKTISATTSEAYERLLKASQQSATVQSAAVSSTKSWTPGPKGSGARPISATTGRRLQSMGSARSTLQVGSLLKPAQFT